MPDAEWPTALEQRDMILRDFDPDGEVGDRRQEVVFIGSGMDETAIAAQLDSALLSDDEMVRVSRVVDGYCAVASSPYDLAMGTLGHTTHQECINLAMQRTPTEPGVRERHNFAEPRLMQWHACAGHLPPKARGAAIVAVAATVAERDHYRQQVGCHCAGIKDAAMGTVVGSSGYQRHAYTDTSCMLTPADSSHNRAILSGGTRLRCAP